MTAASDLPEAVERDSVGYVQQAAWGEWEARCGMPRCAWHASRGNRTQADAETMLRGHAAMVHPPKIPVTRVAPAAPDALRDRVLALAEHWSGCWCTQTDDYGNQQQERDCPSHGSGDCVHMAEGIVVSLRALLGGTNG